MNGFEARSTVIAMLAFVAAISLTVTSFAWPTMNADRSSPEGTSLMRPRTGPSSLVLQQSIRAAKFYGTVIGVVADSESLAPISLSSICILDLSQCVNADVNGVYHFDALSEGSYLIEVAAPCYEPETRMVEVDGFNIAINDFNLVSLGAEHGEDVDCDGTVNAVDVQVVINTALHLVSHPWSDVNGDDDTNAIDVQLVINAALWAT